MKIAEIFGIDDGPLYEEIRRNILHINGGRPPPPAQPRQPGLHARAPRTSGARPCAASSRSSTPRVEGDGRCEVVEAFAKPYPSLTIATVMGAALTDGAEELHEWSTGSSASSTARR